MVGKILNEENCSIEVALAWAISANNCLQNSYGFSPNSWCSERFLSYQMYMKINLQIYKIIPPKN